MLRLLLPRVMSLGLLSESPPSHVIRCTFSEHHAIYSYANGISSGTDRWTTWFGEYSDARHSLIIGKTLQNNTNGNPNITAHRSLYEHEWQ